MTLREYFTKHPAYESNGRLDITDNAGILTFCNVPMNDAVWRMLKKDRLDDEVPEAAAGRVGSVSKT